MIRATHTFAVIEISRPAFSEIREKLVANGYQHAIFNDAIEGVETIVMDGLGLQAGAPIAAPASVEKETAEPLYYAQGGKVHRRPIHTPQPGGGENITLGFPVCKMTDYVGPGAAETLAALMNAGDRALKEQGGSGNG